VRPPLVPLPGVERTQLLERLRGVDFTMPGLAVHAAN
jgi:hypothetical protein